MSATGDFDRPGTPGNPGAWDARSAQLLDVELDESMDADVDQGVDADADEAVAGGEVPTRRDTHAERSTHERSASERYTSELFTPELFTPERSASERFTSERFTSERSAPEPSAPDSSAAGAGARAETEQGGRGRPAPTAAPARTAPATPSPADRRPPTPRRGAVDPVKALMHRHRELCERAVDPLEIAAGLEAHGVTDRTAARFRHRDVFSLAEEMYARVPRSGDQPASAPPSAVAPERARPAWLLLSLLPGTLGAATVAGLRLTDGRARLFVTVAGVLAVAAALRAVLRRGPLSRPYRTGPGARPAGTRGGTWWLLAYAGLGDALLAAALTGGPDGLPDGTAVGAWPFAAAPVLALALSCAPAAWCAHLLSAGARRKLAASRGLEEFATAVRPLLLGVFALFLAALTGLLALCAVALDEPAGAAQTLTLGALLLLARLLTTHGATRAPGLVLRATAVGEAAVLAAVFTARLPGCGFLATPVDLLVDALGPGSVPALLCGASALTLLIHATRTLTRASAHARADHPR
ncbi:hypothetical protein [Streptomyces sp. NPDC014805]|uniref:hypothetical protein n=1 Tax=Streptomyces sp. NPDC014805 TaxID=3364919 RepID=UPI0036FE7383